MAIIKTNVFQFRVSDEELQQIETCAAASLTRPSEWARHILLQIASQMNANPNPIRIEFENVALVMNKQGYAVDIIRKDVSNVSQD